MIDISSHGGIYGGGKMVGKWEEKIATASSNIPKNSPVYVSTNVSPTQTVASSWKALNQNSGWYDMCVKVKISEDRYFVITGGYNNFSSRTAEIISIDSNGVPSVYASLGLGISARVFGVTQLTPTRVFVVYSESSANQSSKGCGMIIEYGKDNIRVILDEELPSYGSVKNASFLLYNNSNRGVLALCTGKYDIGYSDIVGLSAVDIEFNSDFSNFTVLGATKHSTNISENHYVYLLDCFVTPTNDIAFVFHKEMYVFSKIDGQNLSTLKHKQLTGFEKSSAGLHVETIGDNRIILSASGFISFHYDTSTNLWVVTELNAVDDLKMDDGYEYRQSIPYATFRSGEFYGVNEHSNWTTRLEEGVYLLSAKRYLSSSNYHYTLLSSFCFNMGTLKKGTFTTSSPKYGSNVQSSHSFYNRNNGILTVICNQYINNGYKPYSVGIHVGVDVSHTAYKAGINDGFIGVTKVDANSGGNLKFLKLKL